MFIKNSTYISLVCFVFALLSCSEEEGLGGRASISGQVKTISIDKRTGDTLGEFFTPKEDVFIFYGDNSVYNDDMETSYDGKFRFEYLQKGFYEILIYSECEPCIAEVEPVLREVEIKERKENVDLGIIEIIKYD